MKLAISPVLLATVLGLKPMEKDSHPSVAEDNTVVIADPSPSNQGGLNEKPGRDSTIQEHPDIEIMRDAVHDFPMEDAPIWPDQGYDVEPDRVLEEQIMKHIEASSPVVEEILVSGDPSIPLPQAEEPQSVASEKAHENFNLGIPFGYASPGLAIGSTPPVEQPRAKQRQKEGIFMTNKLY